MGSRKGFTAQGEVRFAELLAPFSREGQRLLHVREPRERRLVALFPCLVDRAEFGEPVGDGSIQLPEHGLDFLKERSAFAGEQCPGERASGCRLASEEIGHLFPQRGEIHEGIGQRRWNRSRASRSSRSFEFEQMPEALGGIAKHLPGGVHRGKGVGRTARRIGMPHRAEAMEGFLHHVGIEPRPRGQIESGKVIRHAGGIGALSALATAASPDNPHHGARPFMNSRIFSSLWLVLAMAFLAGCEKITDADKTAAVETVRANLEAIRARDVDAIAATVHPASPNFEGAKAFAQHQAERYVLLYDLKSAEFDSAKGGEIRVRYVLETRKVMGPDDLKDHRETGLRILRRDMGKWKLWATHVEKTEALGPATSAPQ